MRQRRNVAVLAAVWLGLGPGLAAAQTTAYTQSGPASNPNAALEISRVTPGMRVPVRTTVSAPLAEMSIGGYQDMVCAKPRPEIAAKYGEGRLRAPAPDGGELDLRERLTERLGALNLERAKSILQGLEKKTDRASQFAELFGIALPPSSDDFPRTYGAQSRLSPTISLRADQQLKLNTGQEVTVGGGGDGDSSKADPDGATAVTSLRCLTLPQIDAAIAEAKRVYAAVIAVMEGGRGGLSATTPSSSGLQTQTPKGK